MGAGGGRLARGASLKVARFGDNMRQVAVTEGDKVEAQARLGFSVNGYGVNELVERVAAVGDADVDGLVAAYEDAYDVAAPLRPGGDRHAELRTAARIEAGLRSFLEDGGFGAFTDTFEDLGGLEQLPGHRRPADDGRRLRLRRRRRLEGRRPRPHPQVMADGLPGGTSFMEDYTYHLGDPVPEVLGAHMLEVCPSIAATGRRARSTRSRSAAGPTRSGSSSTPRPGPPSSSASPTWATGSG